MPSVTIRIYQQEGTAAQPDRKLIKTKFLDIHSTKKLTGKQAGKILANTFPEFEDARKGMVKIPSGWLASRTVQPTEKCTFHYIWEYAEVVENTE